MIDFAVETLSHENSETWRSLVRDMAHKWPDASALSIAFSLTSAAARIEDLFGAKASSPGYRLASLVAADIYALEAMGQCPARAADLLQFWRRVDPYFLQL